MILYSAIALLGATYLLFCLTFPAAAIIIVFILNYTVGIFELFDLQVILVKLVAELSVVLVFIKTIIDKSIIKSRYRFYGVYAASALFLFSLASFLINDGDVLGYLYFLRILFIYYLLYLAILNGGFKAESLLLINKVIISLCLLQLPIVFVKMMVLGQSEKVAIGTLSMVEGSLSVTFPLLAIAFLTSFYLNTKQIKYLILICGYLLFAIVGAKRAIVVYVPLIIIIVLAIHFRNQTVFLKLFTNHNFMKNFIKLFILCTLGLYIVVRTNPTLNPEGEFGGSFDPKFVVHYIVEYETRTREGNEEFLGRIPALIKTFQVVTREGPLQLAVGMGPGDIVQSRFVQGSQTSLLDKYGLGYGARTSFVWFFIQLGAVGVLLFFCMQYSIIKPMIKHYLDGTVEQNVRPILIGFFGTAIVFFFDFTSYSHTFLSTGALIGTYYYIAAYVTLYIQDRCIS